MNAAISQRDDFAWRYGLAVTCVVCGQSYYPGLATDRKRPRDAKGNKIRVTMASMKGYCGMSCQRQEIKIKGNSCQSQSIVNTRKSL